jgi:predicted metallopeptidase
MLMRTLLLTLSLAAATLPSDARQAQPTPPNLDGTWRARMHDTWTRGDGQQWVNLQLDRDGRHNFGISVPVSDLAGLGPSISRLTGRNVRFTVRRDAGALEFEGNFDDGRGSGTWRFAADSGYVAAMRKTYGELSGEQVLKLAIHDVSRSFVSELQGQGYANLSLDDLTKMRIHGVTPAFIQEVKAAGYDKLPVEDLIRMRIHGVTPEFIREFRDLGYRNLDIEELVKLRIHGVSPSFIRELRDLGYKDLPTREVVKMRIHGVTVQFIKELRELGYANVPVEDLVKLRIHGVTPAFIRDVKAAGFKDMSPDDLVDFSIHGGRRWLKKRA